MSTFFRYTGIDCSVPEAATAGLAAISWRQYLCHLP